VFFTDPFPSLPLPPSRPSLSAALTRLDQEEGLPLFSIVSQSLCTHTPLSPWTSSVHTASRWPFSSPLLPAFSFFFVFLPMEHPSLWNFKCPTFSRSLPPLQGRHPLFGSSVYVSVRKLSCFNPLKNLDPLQTQHSRIEQESTPPHGVFQPLWPQFVKIPSSVLYSS